MNALRRIGPFLKPYWRQILFSVFAVTMVVGAELMIPRQIQRIIDVGIANLDRGVIINASLLMIGLSLLSMFLSFLNTIFATRASEGFAADLRGAAFHKVQQFSFGNLDKTQTGELLVRMTSDVNMAKTAVIMTLMMLFRAPLMLVGNLILLIITSPKLALTLVIILPITVVLIYWYSVQTEPMFKSVQARLDRLNTIMQENIAGVRVVRSFVRGNHEMERFEGANLMYMERSIRVNQLVAMLLPSMMVLINLAVAATIWAGGSMAIAGELTTGEIVAFSNYLLMAMMPILMLGMILPQLYAAGVSVERIVDVIDEEPTVVDRPDSVELVPASVAGRLVFENVTLDYDTEDGGHEPALKNVSFVAEPGQMVAILGATGSGKSTLANAIPRFYDVSEGRVTIDGIDVRDISQESLRSIVTIALQEPVLFSGTVADNIRLGRPEATDDEVIAAARVAQAHDFIMRRPEGYDARVEQRGANFSGGQKQRIAIARAICSDPRILILDDSTSSVDVETEAVLQQALEQLIAGRTRIVVAQRISTVLDADKIVVLENGRVAAVGDHRTLLAESSIYREIYDSQLGGYPSANGHSAEEGASHA